MSGTLLSEGISNEDGPPESCPDQTHCPTLIPNASLFSE